MKLAKKLLGIAALIAVIGFMALPLTGCPVPESEDGDNDNKKNTSLTETPTIVYYTGDSIEEFAAWLAEQEEGILCDVKLTLDALGGKSTEEGSLGFVLKNNPNVKVKLDLSDSTFTSIEGQVFLDCTSLVGITIPNSVTSIMSSAFGGCTSLAGITVGEDNSKFVSVDGILYNKAKTDIVVVPKKITGNVTIPDGVTFIHQNAFMSCTSLTGITIIGNGVTTIENSAFSGCTSLTDVTIRNGVTSIGGYAFEGCTSLTSVTIGRGVTSIGIGAFQNCTSLAGITVSNGNTSFASVDGILYNYAKTQFIFIPKAKTEITIPDTVTDFGYFFQSNPDIVSVTIGSGSIVFGAFQDCTSLTSVTIGDGVTSIGSGAFYGCTSLTSATIGSGITSIGDPDTGTDMDFYGCTSLTSITIGSSVIIRRPQTNLSNCTSLTSITVDENNPNYASVDGIVYNKAITQPVLVPRGITGNVTIPDTVTSINYAFANCTSLTSVTIGSGVTSIANYAFSRCTSLTSITFATGSNIPDANFEDNVSPEGSTGAGGNTLKTAYNAASPKEGTYTREANGSEWSKQN